MVAMLCHGVPKAERHQRRKVEVNLVYPNRRHHMDPDNVWKVLLDSMVKVGLLWDDRDESVQTVFRSTVKLGEKGTELFVIDLEPKP